MNCAARSDENDLLCWGLKVLLVVGLAPKLFRNWNLEPSRGQKQKLNLAAQTADSSRRSDLNRGPGPFEVTSSEKARRLPMGVPPSLFQSSNSNGNKNGNYRDYRDYVGFI